jgi:KipI family sensor histidine kinase inhibitor
MVEQLGDRAIRFARPASSARAIVRAVRAWPGVTDVVVARDTVAAYFAGAPEVDDAHIAALAALPDDPTPPREHVLRAIYDGDDLDELARTTGVDVARVHAAATYTVDQMGFLPGFAYLVGLDPRLAVPRRATPRARLAAGSIAIAAGYTAVYPLDSPGGWHLIGRVVDARMFGPEGSLLSIGDRVRFTC